MLLRPSRQRLRRASCFAMESVANPAKRVARSRMAGAEGFEPSDAGIKIRCLTAWLRPKKRAEKAADHTHLAPTIQRTLLVCVTCSQTVRTETEQDRTCCVRRSPAPRESLRWSRSA